MLASSHTGDVSHIRTSAKADRAPDISCAACRVPEYHDGPAQEDDRKAERNPAGFRSRMGASGPRHPLGGHCQGPFPGQKGSVTGAKSGALNGYVACGPHFFIRGCQHRGQVASNTRAGVGQGGDFAT